MAPLASDERGIITRRCVRAVKADAGFANCQRPSGHATEEQMIAYLKALATRFRDRWSGPWPPLPGDAHSPVRELRPRAPGGRNSAVALEEPIEPSLVRADGARRKDAARFGP